MWGKNKDIIRNVRIDSELNDLIIDIAKAEQRTISNTIQLLLREAVHFHLRAHPKTLEIINSDNADFVPDKVNIAGSSSEKV